MLRRAPLRLRAAPASPMRVAVISDIHANLPALEAVREAIDAGVARRDLVPRRPGRLRRRSRTRAARGRRAHGRLPGRQPRPRRARHARLSTTSPDDAAAAARSGRAACSTRARTPDCLAARRPSASATGVGLYHASPRDPVWEYVLTWEAAHAAIHDSGTRVDARRSQPRAARDRRTARGAAGGHAPGGTEIELAGGTLAAQPRLGRPAPRRRPRSGLAAARPRRRRASFRRARTTSSGRRRDP